MDIYFIGFENIHFFEFFNFIYDNSPIKFISKMDSTYYNNNNNNIFPQEEVGLTCRCGLVTNDIL